MYENVLAHTGGLGVVTIGALTLDGGLALALGGAGLIIGGLALFNVTHRKRLTVTGSDNA